jgi:hypothetical protein
MPDGLYIIGNGFDLYHCLDTSYMSFATFLKDNYVEVYDLYLNYFGLPDIDSGNKFVREQWSNFENELANIDYNYILEDNASFPNMSSDDYRDRDLYDYQFNIKAKVEILTNDMFKAFREFIIRVNYHDVFYDRLVDFESNSVFINFNYTDTLEKYYGINPKNILYIHGKVNSLSDEVVLGHGINPSSFEEEDESPPLGLNEEELEEWREEANEKWDFSREMAKSELRSYYRKTFKPIRDIIAKNQVFFDRITLIKNVFVLGHSISKVDQPYFIKVMQSINDKSIPWIVSYYSDSDSHSHIMNLHSLGLKIEQIQLTKIDALRQRRQLSIFENLNFNGKNC